MQIAIGLYDGFAALDAIGPYQVFTVLPGAEVVLCAARPGRIVDEAGLLQLDVEHAFDEIPTPDVLLVPGGVNTRLMVTGGAPIVDWVRAAHPTTTFTTSVCTGALILGAAGLLDGLPATTHWCAYDHLRDLGAEPTEQRVVFTDRIATAAGVSAGIDLALALVGRLHGDDVAEAIQLGIEYDPQPPYDAGAPSKARPEIVELVTGVMRDAEAKLSSAGSRP
jgi:transcriptional regulator GlxA family with amidase domain